MRKIIHSLSRYLEEKVSYLVEEVGIIYHVGFFIGVVLFCGILYYILTPGSHGIGQTDITIFTGIYFSTVTISSLGYGDIHPMGASKVIACIEVLLGLSSIGIMIAKVTSRRMSYRVSRLFSSDIQKHLENFVEVFETSHEDFVEITPRFAAVYQDTPGEASIDEDGGLLIERFRRIIGNFYSACITLSAHFSEGLDLDDYFQNVPVSSVRRVGNAVNGAFSMLNELLTSLPSNARNEILEKNNRQRIADAIDLQIKVCDLVNQCQHAINDQDTLKEFHLIKEACEQVANYVAVPEEPQLGHILQDSDEPQDFSGVDNE